MHPAKSVIALASVALLCTGMWARQFLDPSVTPLHYAGVQGSVPLWTDPSFMFGTTMPNLLYQDEGKDIAERCGRLLEKSDTLETKIGTLVVKYFIERYEKCVRITYLGTGTGGGRDTVVELPALPDTDVTVGDKKIKVRAYAKKDRNIAIAKDPNGPVEWTGQWCVFAVECTTVKFVQFKRRITKWSNEAATTGDWKVDAKEQDPSKPSPGTVPKPKQGGDGQGSHYDAPGGGGAPDKDVPDNTTYTVTDEYETFVCCDKKLIGYWSWTESRTYKYMNKLALSPPAENGSAPTWHSAADQSPNWAKVKCD
jgi:hypothetical protein